MAVDILSGWLDQAGPCYAFADHDAVVDHMMAVAQELAFDELPARDELLARWQQAAARFEGLRGGAVSTGVGGVLALSLATRARKAPVAICRLLRSLVNLPRNAPLSAR